MKLLSVLFTTFLSISVLFSVAQNAGHSRKGMLNLPQKGYYAIGDNFKKLIKAPAPVAHAYIIPQTSKGYYSISENTNKLPKKAVWNVQQNDKPVITKGYYSITKPPKKLSAPDSAIVLR